MADWNFAVLDDEYNHLNGGPWAGLNGFANAEDLEDVGAHWSSDTWNEPYPDAGQPEPDHTSHAPPPPSSPPLRHVNDGPLQNSNSGNSHIYHNPFRHLPHESLPTNTNYHGPSREIPTSNTHQPVESRGPLPQPSHSRGSFTTTTAQQSAPEQGTRNQTLPQPHAYETDYRAVETNSDDDAVMPPRRRPAANGSPVDLTQSPDMATASASQQSRTRKRSSTSQGGDEGSAKKRTKRTSMSAARVDVEDLEDEAPSADAELLQAQQREALKMQETKKDDEPVKIGQRTCIICLENYTNATTAICGHIFCHECLTRALMASEKNNDRGKGNCPACRKAINRRNAKEVIPISFLKKSAFKTKGRQAHNR